MTDKLLDIVTPLNETILALAEKNAALEQQVEQYRDELIWCSGAGDFQEEGIARWGWLKLCAPLLASQEEG